MGWSFEVLPPLAEPQTLRYALKQVERGYSDSLDPCVVMCLVNEDLVDQSTRPRLTAMSIRTLNALIEAF